VSFAATRAQRVPVSDIARWPIEILCWEANTFDVRKALRNLKLANRDVGNRARFQDEEQVF
jgi:hypothetical protein